MIPSRDASTGTPDVRPWHSWKFAQFSREWFEAYDICLPEGDARQPYRTALESCLRLIVENVKSSNL
jgi:hypothetical protein